MLLDFGDDWLLNVAPERFDLPDDALDWPRLLAEQGEAARRHPDWDV